MYQVIRLQDIASPSASSRGALAASALRACVRFAAAAILFLAALQVVPAQAQKASYVPTWSYVAPPTTPGPLYNSASAFFPDIQQIVAFGGSTAGSNGSSNTYTFDGTTWTLQQPTTSPSARQYAVMAYDPAISKIVLYGGERADGADLTDTWTYDGVTWQQLQPATVPPEGYGGAMVYDDALGKIVLVEGTSTYLFDGTNWTRQNTPANPPDRIFPGIAYDAAHSQVVLFGGSDGTTSYSLSYAETYTYNGFTWTKQNPVARPGARERMSMVFDPVSQTVLLYGGGAYDVLADGSSDGSHHTISDLWQWDGSGWNALDIRGSGGYGGIVDREGALMAPFPRTGQIVLYGGLHEDIAGGHPLNTQYAMQLGPVSNFPAANVCSNGAPAPCSQVLSPEFVFTTGGTISTTPQFLTQGGQPSQDFSASAGGCAQSGSTATYSTNDACLLTVNFTPKGVGRRLGVVNLLDTAGRIVASHQLSGTGTAPQGLFSTPTGTVFAAGLSTPRGLTVDGDGNVYVLETGRNLLDKFTPAGAKTQYTLPAANPGGTAVDGAGNIFYGSGDLIYEIAAGTTNSVVYARGIGAADNNLVVDTVGNLFVTNFSTFALYKVPAAAPHTPVLLFPGNTYVAGSGVTGTGRIVATAIDQKNTLYLADYTNGFLMTLAPGSTVPVALINTDGVLRNPHGLAVDPAGNVYVTNAAGGGLLRYSAPFNNRQAAWRQTLPSYTGSTGAALGPDGTLYLLDDNSIYQYLRAAGPALSFPVTVNGGSSSRQTQTFENDGSAPLTISSIASSSNNFTAAGAAVAPSPACGGTLAVAGICGLSFNFMPQTGGALSANGIVTDDTLNTPGSTQTIALSGTATLKAQTISFTAPASPTAVNTSASLVATSSSGLPVYFVITAGSQYATLSGTNGSTITYTAPGAVEITAHQDGNTGYSAAPAVAYTVNVLAVATYTAPTTPVGTQSSQQTAYVIVSKAGTVASTTVSTQGAALADYTKTTERCIAKPYAAGDSCQVQYTFQPTAPGRRAGAIVLRDSSGAVMGTAFLSGIGTAPLALLTSPAGSNIGSGFPAPRGLSTDAAGNLYLKETAGTVLDKLTPTGGLTQYAVPTGAGGTAVDGAGNLFYSNGDSIYEILSGTTASVLYASGIGNADNNLVLDSAGNLYATDQSGNAWRVPAGSHTASLLFAAGSAVVGGVSGRLPGAAIDASDNLYFADSTYNRVYQVAAGSGTPVTLIAADAYLSSPQTVNVDAAGNVYVTNGTGNSAMLRYSAPFSGGGSAHAERITTMGGQEGAALTADGTFYTFSAGNLNKYIRTVGSALAFPGVATGSSSAAKVVELENDGNASLGLTSLSTSNPAFAVAGAAANSFAPACATSLPAAGMCGIAVTFKPTAPGSQTASAIVTDNSLNAAGATQQIALSGNTLVAQTINFTQPASPATKLSSATLAATGGGSGNPVTFAITGGTGSATLSGANNSTITYTGVGTVNITASQAGAGASYTAAPDVTMTVQVVLASQAISFTQPASPVNQNSSATLVATGGGSGNPVTFAITAGAATLSGPNNSTITYTSSGSVTITASQAGDANYAAAPSVSVTVQVGAVFAGFRLSAPANPTTGINQSVTVTALDSNGAVKTDFYDLVKVTVSDPAGSGDSSAYYQADRGSRAFNFRLNTAGTQTITATSGSVSRSITVVTPGYLLVLSGSNSIAKFYTTGTADYAPVSVNAPNTGLATDSLGRAYSLNSSTNTFIRYGVAGGGTANGAATGGGLSSPNQLAVDGAGTTWITNGNGSLTQFAYGAQSTVPVALSPASGYVGPYSAPTGIAIDISGNVWVANSGNNTITEVLGGAAPAAPLATGLLNGTTGARP